MPGTPVRWPTSRSCGSFSTVPWCACGSTARRLPSRCSSLSACAKPARRYCSRSRAWAAKAPRHGALSSTISSGAVCDDPSSSSSMARQGSKRQLPPSGTARRCRGHKHRNLLAHAPERLHEEIGADYNDMIYAATAEEIQARRKAFIRKWRLKHRAVANSLEEAGDRLFTFTRLPPSQWRSARTTNAIERLHEEFKRRIKTQTVLPSADTAAMLFWALLASGQINMRKVDGWHTLAANLIGQPIDLEQIP